MPFKLQENDAVRFVRHGSHVVAKTDADGIVGEWCERGEPGHSWYLNHNRDERGYDAYFHPTLDEFKSDFPQG